MIPIIDHINRYVSNTDTFVKFYQNALGYELIGQDVKSNGNKFAVLKGFGHELFISEKDDFAADDTSNFRHLGYSVKNIQDLLEQLKASGFVPKETQIIAKRFSKQFYIKDPDGFEIDLIEWTDKNEFYESLMQK
ncbi:MAG: VOC family protein [Ignavibacteriales bacterium]